MRALHAQIAAAITVSIDVDGGVLLEFGRVVLSPFGRAQKHGLLAVPGAIDNGALRLPALLEQFAQRPRFFEQRYLPGNWVFGAVDPAIVVVAADNPLIGRFGALDLEDDVVNRLDVPVERNFQVYLRGAGADVIGDGQSAAKTFRSHRAFQRGQQRPGIAIGDGQRRNFGERGNIFNRQALHVALGADAGRGGIAGIDRHVHHTAALHAILVAHWALG